MQNIIVLFKLTLWYEVLPELDLIINLYLMGKNLAVSNHVWQNWLMFRNYKSPGAHPLQSRNFNVALTTSIKLEVWA